MSGAGDHGAIVSQAMRDLMAQWEQTAASWRDRARAEFEREHLAELIPAVRAASNAMQEIEGFLRQIRKECS